MADFDVQANFAMQKGKRDSDRLTEEALIGISNLLHGQFVQVDGRLCEVRLLGVPKLTPSGEWRFLFDVLKPSASVDHIEFTVTKTGWGADLTPDNLAEPANREE